jgi:ABC-type multidrug transport system ATPase subunit
LSGGERKRTSIGYDLIRDPHLCILDEPTSGLDSNTAFKVIKHMKKLSKT